MTTGQPPRFPAFRIVVMLVILVNLILTIAIIMQVRELQQRVASLPPDLATRRDVSMLRPLRIREILMQNCVECHSSRRLGVTISMEPADIQRTVQRMQTHPGANISPGEFERIATIRRMAALPGSGVRSDQVLAIAQAFDKLVDQTDSGSAGSSK